VTTSAWLFVVLSSAAAVAGWVAAAIDRRDVALPARVAAAALVVFVALLVDTDDGALRAWFVVGLIAAVAGAGLLAVPAERVGEAIVALTLAQFAFAFGLSLADQEDVAVLVGIVIAVIVVRDVSRRVLAGVRRRARGLLWVAAVYVGALAVVVALAVATVEPLAIAGSVLLVGAAVAELRLRFGGRVPSRTETVVAMVLFQAALLVMALSLTDLERLTA
jgi:hypothetical protein